LDVASIEADITVDPQTSDTLKAVGVNEITGIALGDSADETPAFSGAKFIGELQAFRDRSLSIQQGGEVDKITIDEIRTIIKDDSISPSDLFGRDALTDDPVVKGYVKAEVQQATAGEFSHRKREEKTFDEKKAEYETKIKDKDDEIIKLKKATATTKVGDLFKAEKDKRELDEKQEKFIDANLKKFEVSDPDKIEEEFSKFLDNQIDDFKTVSEVFGHKVKDGDGTKKKGEEKETDEDQETDENGDDDDDGGEVDNIFLPKLP
jgi:hypothetical protein